MRKTIFAFAATLILFATISCHKDKDDNVTIRGKWFLKTEHDQSYKNGTPTDTSTYEYTGSPYFEFATDTTLNVKDEDGNTYTATYTYNADTKKLTITDDGDSTEFDVTKLTSSEMTLHEEDTYTLDENTYKDVTDTYLKR